MRLVPLSLVAGALALASKADIALVDLNLRDGPSGIGIGKILAQTHGVTVIFMTANPSQLGDGVSGTVGVLPKPATEREISLPTSSSINASVISIPAVMPADVQTPASLKWILSPSTRMPGYMACSFGA